MPPMPPQEMGLSGQYECAGIPIWRREGGREGGPGPAPSVSQAYPPLHLQPRGALPLLQSRPLRKQLGPPFLSLRYLPIYVWRPALVL